MPEPKVSDKNTPYWWEAAPVTEVPSQPLAKQLDVLIVGKRNGAALCGEA